VHAVRKANPVDLQKPIIIYISPQGFQSFNVYLMEELLLIDDFGSCHNKCSKTGRTDVLGSSAYFVNKCSYIVLFYWSNEYNYLVETFEFPSVGHL
jgi:hypothetical protein